MSRAVKFVPDFGIGAPFFDDLPENAALCGDERGRGVLLGGCRLWRATSGSVPAECGSDIPGSVAVERA